VTDEADGYGIGVEAAAGRYGVAIVDGVVAEQATAAARSGRAQA
jgi:hypothetical protein